MASTSHKTAEEIEEHFDEPHELQRKVELLAQWVKEAAMFTVFTGAGVSTSAGIPDFRGPQGVWTLKAQGKKVTARHAEMLGCLPTPGHMALLGLQRAGHLQHLISTNTDGLHLRSGFPSANFTELHGNTNSEGCPKQPVGACSEPYAGGGCGAIVFRDERCRKEGLGVHEHATGRFCECGKPLQDTIINFNENLWPVNVEAARRVAAQSDLMMTVGSSLRVSSWAPAAVGRRKDARLVVVNLQWTPLDTAADLKINARSDDVFRLLSDQLACEIPPFTLRRYLRVSRRVSQKAAAEMKRILRGRGCEAQVRGAEKRELATLLEAQGISCDEILAESIDASGVPYAWMTGLVTDSQWACPW